MKIIESVKFKCDYCGTEHKRRDMAESCEHNCYILKMSSCKLCKHYREHAHMKSPPTRFMKVVMKREESWVETYCRLLKFYERDVSTRQATKSFYKWGWGNLKRRLTKDFRNGNKGASCTVFEKI